MILEWSLFFTINFFYPLQARNHLRQLPSNRVCPNSFFTQSHNTSKIVLSGLSTLSHFLNGFHFHIYKLRFYSNFTPHVTLFFGRSQPYAQYNDMPLQGRCIAGSFMWLLFRLIFSNSFPCTTYSSCCLNIRMIPTPTFLTSDIL